MGSKKTVWRFLRKPQYTSVSEFLISLNPISDIYEIVFVFSQFSSSQLTLASMAHFVFIADRAILTGFSRRSMPNSHDSQYQSKQRLFWRDPKHPPLGRQGQGD
jgi:hypothetical protein